MNKIFRNIFAFLFFILSSGFAQEKIFSPAELKEDYKIFRGAYEEIHPSLYTYTEKDSLDVYFNLVETQLSDSLTELEFFQLLSPLITKINCGHTEISPSKKYIREQLSKGKFFPFVLKFLDDKIYIKENFSSDSSLVKGTEIISINKLSSNEIIEKIVPNLGSDGYNKTFKYWKLEHEFSIYYKIFIEDPESFNIKYKYLNSPDTLSKIIPALTFKEGKKYYNRWTPKKKVEKKPLKFEIVSNTSTALMTINTFSSKSIKKSGQNFDRYLRSSRRKIKNKNIESVIIDLRDNTGGTYKYAMDLYASFVDTGFIFHSSTLLKGRKFHYYKYMSPTIFRLLTIFISKTDSCTYTWSRRSKFNKIQKPKRNNFTGPIYVLENGGSFSAATQFIATVYNNKRGLIVGEESGGGHYGSSAGYVLKLNLPNTKIRALIPVIKFTNPVPGILKGRGIFPQDTVRPSLQDFIQEIDSELKYTLDLIHPADH